MFYRIDSRFRIIDLSADWDDFALANGGGPRACRTAWLGRCVTDGIAGDATRMFLRAAVDSARRLGQPRHLPYRCDNPGERRWFGMQVEALTDGSVTVSHQVLRIETRVPRPERLATRCSQCLREHQRREPGWLLAARLRQAADGADELLDAVCPDCRRHLTPPRTVLAAAGAADGLR